MTLTAIRSQEWLAFFHLPFFIEKITARRQLFKLLLVMNLTLILLIAGCLGASAKGLGQSISLHELNQPLEKVLKQIEKQSGYQFVYTVDVIEKGKPVTIKVEDATIKEVLRICFKDQPLRYTIVDKVVVIKTQSSSFNETEIQLPPLIDVTGRVVTENGEPVAGASVMVKGSKFGTKSDVQGYFEMKAVNESAVLVISAVNIEQYELNVNGRSDLGTIEVRVKVTSQGEIIINAGYYNVKDKERTGNISRVTAKDIENQPLTSPLVALQGRMAGVEITQLSGMPGAAPSIRIRGQNSLRYDANEPLYIIDGVPFDATPVSTSGFLLRVGTDPLSTLNISNIESIEILKDADATAIYGSRGSNGVVLITTKRGKPGKPTLDVNSYYGIGKVPYFIDMLNTKQYVEMRREAFTNSGVTPTTANAVDLLLWDTTRYTDWQRKLIGGTASLSNMQASVYGGSAQTSFRIGTAIQRQGTVFPGDFHYQRIGGFFNLNHKSKNNKLTAILSTNYGFDKNQLFPGGASEMANAVFLPPNAPEVYDQNGNLNWENSTWNNPLAVMKRSQEITSSSINLNGTLDYKIFPGLHFKTSLGYTNYSTKELTKTPKNSLDPASNTENSATFKTVARDSWIIEPQLEYTRTIKRGTLDFLMGTTFQKSTSEGLLLQGTGFVDESLMGNLGTADNIFILPSSTGKTEYKYTAIFGRLAYNLEKTYFLNLTGRRDGSSRFGPGKRFANLGAAGAAWIFSNENFIQKNFPFISFGKWRASYGITGSDQIGEYGYLDTWGTTNGAGGLYPTQLSNPDFSWETNKKFEVALDLGFINDRVQLSASWYMNKSSNQLVGYPLASITGFASVQANLAATVQNKGWEIEVNTSNIQSKRFSWNSGINVTLPKNKLIEFPGIEQTSYANQYVVGEPLNIRFLYQYTGLDPKTGLYTILDANGDGRYDSKDKIVIKNVGRRYFGGFSNTLSYKDFQLDFLIEFVKQIDNADVRFLNGSFAPGSLGIVSSNINGNVASALLNRWQKEGDNTDIQKYLQGSGDTRFFGYAASSNAAYNSDASFIRLKTLSLSYQLPESITNHAGLGKCKLYIQGQNLFTLTKYIGWDPQSPYTGALPALKMITGGLQIRL